jgi:hypothetical protein
MQLEGRAPDFARAQQKQLGFAPFAGNQRQNFERAEARLSSHQNFGQSFGSVDHMQVTLWLEPSRGDIQPSRKRGAFTKSFFAQGTLRHTPGSAIKVGWIGDDMIEGPLAQILWQGLKISRNDVQTVATRQLGIGCHTFHPQEVKPGDTRAETKSRSADATAQIKDGLTGSSGDRGREQDGVNACPISLTRLPKLDFSAQKGVPR